MAVSGAVMQEELNRSEFSELKSLLVEMRSELDTLKSHNVELQSRAGQAEKEIAQLRQELSSDKAGRTLATASATVSPLGEAASTDGRRLSSGATPTCCRWTKDGTCGTVESSRYRSCSELHEYLEGKTTTHEFADLDECLGSDASKWAWKYDPINAAVPLSNDSNAIPVTSPKTPLRVTHAQNCSAVEPTLTLQLDTHIPGTLSVGGGRGTTSLPIWSK